MKGKTLSVLILIILVSTVLMGCGSVSDTLYPSGYDSSNINVTPILTPTVIPTPTAPLILPTTIPTIAPTATPSPTPTPIVSKPNPFGQIIEEGFKLEVEFENLNYFEPFPEGFDTNAHYQYLINKYGWGPDDYFYEYTDRFFECTDEELEYEFYNDYRGRFYYSYMEALVGSANMRDMYGKPIYYKDNVLMEADNGFCSHAYGRVEDIMIYDDQIDVYVYWTDWVEIDDEGYPIHMYSMELVDYLRNEYVKLHGGMAEMNYLMDRMSAVYELAIGAKISGKEYMSQDFLTRNVFCNTVIDGYYDPSVLITYEFIESY